MNRAILYSLPLMLLAAACDGGGGGGGGSMTSTSGGTPTNPKAGSEPAQKLDPDALMRGPPIGNRTVPAAGNSAAPARP